MYPSIAPASAPSSVSGVIWVQGNIGQTCTDACALIASSCSNSGPWPLSYWDFTALLAVSYDLTACFYLPFYSTCPYSSCAYIYEGSTTYSADPEGDGSTCYYGGGYGTCDAVPDGEYRRFCPCVTSSVSPSYTPTDVPTPAPSTAPVTRFPTLKPEVHTEKPHAKAPSKLPVKVHPTSKPVSKPHSKPVSKPVHKPSGGTGSLLLDMYLKLVYSGSGKQHVKVQQSAEIDDRK